MVPKTQDADFIGRSDAVPYKWDMDLIANATLSLSIFWFSSILAADLEAIWYERGIKSRSYVKVGYIL